MTFSQHSMLAALVAGAFFVGSGVAVAQQSAQQACSADITKFCGGVAQGAGRVA